MLVGVSRSSVRYELLPESEANRALKERIRELASRYKRYGYRRITALLRRSGILVNKKRVHRIWKLEKLQVPVRRRKRRRKEQVCEVVNRAEYRNHVWSWDFVEDSTETGKKIRFLTIVDEYTRECQMIRAERSFGANEVIESLQWLFATRGLPRYIRSDNGSEFIANALKEWLDKVGCGTIYIEPGSPWENPYIESFNGKFRDECLNMHVFRNVEEAQEVVERWRAEYNSQRPHSALGYMTPEKFANSAAALGQQG